MHSEGGMCMFCLLPALVVVAETTGGVIASVGTIVVIVESGKSLVTNE